jgi:hypothetical protein
MQCGLPLSCGSTIFGHGILLRGFFTFCELQISYYLIGALEAAFCNKGHILEKFHHD